MRLILPISNKRSHFSEQPNKLNVKDKSIKNSFDIAETFNNYFVNVGTHLQKKFFQLLRELAKNIDVIEFKI